MPTAEQSQDLSTAPQLTTLGGEGFASAAVGQAVAASQYLLFRSIVSAGVGCRAFAEADPSTSRGREEPAATPAPTTSSVRMTPHAVESCRATPGVRPRARMGCTSRRSADLKTSYERIVSRRAIQIFDCIQRLNLDLVFDENRSAHLPRYRCTSCDGVSEAACLKTERSER